MKLKPILIAIGVILVLLAVAKFTGLIGGDKTEKVTIEKAADRKVVETVTASGKVQPETEVKLSSEVSGEVTELLVKEGDVVKKGQLLIKVRPDVLQSGFERAVASNNTQKAQVVAAEQQLKQANANFDNTEASYKRSQELFTKKVISASEFDAAKAQYFGALADIARLKAMVTSAKYSLQEGGANVKEAGANLAKATIYAPVDGVISKLSVELGDRILGTAQMAGTEIMRISNLSSMEVNVDVNENDINRVNVGDSSIIEVDAFADTKFKGIVTEIASSSKDVGTATSTVDQVTNFNVKVRILAESYSNIKGGAKDLPSPFRPGMSATVDIESESLKGLAIPIQSVFTEDKSKAEKPADNDQNVDKQKSKLSDKTIKQYVYVFNNGTVKRTEVTTGIQNDQYIIIKSGLKANQEVVTGPYSAIQNRLKDGMKVEKTTKDQLFAAPK
ncbi:efflux RND transporter periplasmic adaptor subunit [Pedobacter panaciterrae]|jgi:HlyD family secretion protein|uniref:Efflux RND transporter periplasmic adaptor subunit n=1 Tax=Pedobacter panaciterrae TaxID=363849 RepID=A0ABU8NT28_9SPHI|nr:efflux RND transporter periplasmic adaptor subunit [Pedobacter panaciterrae]NQX54652.1 efflux RND transporter periplasmic adaptor subunit [Pedobacter panaciterrae]